ncbi:MAG: fibronectin type III domain-containing protein [Candidatus Delongbacteria bacterium]|nr:fibronectin type III domain-containing protein [Candidatus Delongbacteria bacterium]
MNKYSIKTLCLSALLLVALSAAGKIQAQKNYNGPPMFLNVNAISWDLKKLNGEGQFSNQYSWMLTGDNKENTEVFWWPADVWHSQMLYQVFNPVCFDDNGFTNQLGEHRIIPYKCVNGGANDYSHEIRRYRPAYVTVDNTPLYQEYRWQVDPTLKSDIHCTWEDIYVNYGLRVRGEVMAFSNPDHQDYVIYKMTYKFTGETKRPLEDPKEIDIYPDQTVTLWTPLSFSFGPSKCGEYGALGFFAYEAEDDLDSWFEMTSSLVTTKARKNLKVAYYWDYILSGSAAYPNGSKDDMGDPERDKGTGHLLSPQIPGFSLLYAPKSNTDLSDDPEQPFSMPHAGIVQDLWNRTDPGIRNMYLGTDERGKFPKDWITEGRATKPEKGPMRFITAGPYTLTKSTGTVPYDSNFHYDSFTVVYAVGVGSISQEMARKTGQDWYQGLITDQQKDSIILTGTDSLAKVMDRAYWAFSQDMNIDDPLPPPDLNVQSDADRVIVKWSYPDNRYYLDPDTQVDDWYAWRVYRKKGAAYVNDPYDNASGEEWKMVFETTDRTVTEYIDTDVMRGTSYYYAVTAVDDGRHNGSGLFPGKKLESSRYVNRTGVPAIPFKAGLQESDKVRVVPNPATVKAGGLGFPGDPNRIVFAKLPYQCKLQIFTETGDLISSFDHQGTDQEVWNQRTDNNQYIMSGCYILAVTNAKNVSGGSLPDQFVKFVIIR